jgi:protein-S-isoprenylcysteine O-methyltransferase Ste14
VSTVALASPVRSIGKLPAKAVVLDVTERTIVFCFFGCFAIRTYNNFLNSQDLRTLLLLFSETLPFIFVLIRPLAAALSNRPSDWIFGLAGSIGPMFITMAPFDPLVPSYIWYTLVIAGMCIQLSAKVFLGLSFGVVAANRGVRIAGPYRVVRHPMYAGYTISHVGVILGMPSLTNAMLYAGVFVLQLIRISREERILRQDKLYREFADKVRSKLIPGVY